jgi:hypothetical protein
MGFLKFTTRACSYEIGFTACDVKNPFQYAVRSLDFTEKGVWQNIDLMDIDKMYSGMIFISASKFLKNRHKCIQQFTIVEFGVMWKDKVILAHYN